MKFASVRELSRNPSRYVDLTEPVIITKHGRPATALIPMDGESLEDFILAKHLDLEGEARRNILPSSKKKRIPSIVLQRRFRRLVHN